MVRFPITLWRASLCPTTPLSGNQHTNSYAGREEQEGWVYWKCLVRQVCMLDMQLPGKVTVKVVLAGDSAALLRTKSFPVHQMLQSFPLLHTSSSRWVLYAGSFSINLEDASAANEKRQDCQWKALWVFAPAGVSAGILWYFVLDAESPELSMEGVSAKGRLRSGHS